MRFALRPLVLLWSCMVLWCIPVFAQEGAVTSAGHGSLYYLLRALVSLGVVVALIYAIYFGLRRLSYTGLPRGRTGLRVLESLHLGGGRWVYVVEVADRILVVGSGADGLRTLAELSLGEYEKTQSQARQRGVAHNDSYD